MNFWVVKWMIRVFTINRLVWADSGFGADDKYNTYSKAMSDCQGVTLSSRGETECNADKQYDKLLEGFSGTECDGNVSPCGVPRQFEKEQR